MQAGVSRVQFIAKRKRRRSLFRQQRRERIVGELGRGAAHGLDARQQAHAQRASAYRARPKEAWWISAIAPAKTKFGGQRRRGSRDVEADGLQHSRHAYRPLAQGKPTTLTLAAGHLGLAEHGREPERSPQVMG